MNPQKPSTWKRVAATVAVLIMVALALGAIKEDPPKLVAEASTLNPSPIPSPTATPAPKAPQNAPTPAPKNITPRIVSDGLTGSIGYAVAGGNCVNEPGVNNPHTGNPINWVATSRTPWIGATVLFTWNHTGVVTGIWSDGSVEVRHRNCPGCQHRYYPGMIRGYR